MKKKTDNQPDLTLQEVTAYNDTSIRMTVRCREQFKRNARSYIEGHPELKDGKFQLDPDNTFQAVREDKHDCNIICDVVAVGTDENGRMTFDLSSCHYAEKDVHISGDVCYGAYVEDWPYALEILLEAFKNPYKPDEEPDITDAKSVIGRIRREFADSIKTILGLYGLDSIRAYDIDPGNSPIVRRDPYNDDETFTLDSVDVEDGNLSIDASNCLTNLTLDETDIPTDILGAVLDWLNGHKDKLRELSDTEDEPIRQDNGRRQ